MLSRFFGRREENKYYNPLRVGVGSMVSVGDADLKDQNFKVVGVNHWIRKIEDESYSFTDYHLKSILRSQEDIRVRCIPSDHRDFDSDPAIILMETLAEFPYSEDFYELVRNEPIINYNDENGELVGSYQRTCDHPGPCDDHLTEKGCKYECRVVVMEDRDRSGRVDKSEVRERQIGYWDFIRDAGSYREALYVEMDLVNGAFEVLKGKELTGDQFVNYKEI